MSEHETEHMKHNENITSHQTDNPEQNCAEPSIAPDEEILRNIIDYSTNLFYTHTIDHEITYISHQSLDMLGYTPEEALIKWTTLVSNNPINEIGYELTCKAIETGITQPPYQLELIHKSGKKIWVEVHESPVVKDGKTVAIVGSLTDISEKKAAENTIKYHLEIETAVADASKLFISPKVDIDRVLQTIGHAVQADRAYLFQFSNTLEMMSNTNEWCAKGILPEIDNLQNIDTCYAPWWMDMLKSHRPIIIEDLDKLPGEAALEKSQLEPQGIKALVVVPIILKDKMLWGFMGFDDTKSPRNWSENDVGILHVISDMIARYLDREKNEQERLKLEKQLYQSQKMESIGRLAGGIAHDFNNTLTGIMGYAELLKMKHSDLNTFEGEAADIILEGTKRAANLTQQLLGFARGGKYVPKPLNINMVIYETSRLIEKSLPQNINIIFELDESAHPVMADKNQMEQVLTNLIFNARDAMPQNGTLTFQSRNVYLGEKVSKDLTNRSPGNYVQFSVIDTGIGIKDDIQQKIFEPFFTTKSSGNGVGLGLATVYGIIKNHDGYVTITSKVGNGTNVSVYLPASENSVISEEVINTEDIRSSNGETILIVDDEENVRSITQIQLQKLGYNTLLAENGEEALLIYETHLKEIDLILLDVLMPGLDGFETFKRLRTLDPDVKVVVMSGFSKKGNASKLLALGARGFIHKPFQIHELSKTVAKVLA